MASSGCSPACRRGRRRAGGCRRRATCGPPSRGARRPAVREPHLHDQRPPGRADRRHGERRTPSPLGWRHATRDVQVLRRVAVAYRPSSSGPAGRRGSAGSRPVAVVRGQRQVGDGRPAAVDGGLRRRRVVGRSHVVGAAAPRPRWTCCGCGAAEELVQVGHAGMPGCMIGSSGSRWDGRQVTMKRGPPLVRARRGWPPRGQRPSTR